MGRYQAAIQRVAAQEGKERGTMASKRQKAVAGSPTLRLANGPQPAGATAERGPEGGQKQDGGQAVPPLVVAGMDAAGERILLHVEWERIADPVKFSLKMAQIWAQLAAQHWDAAEAMRAAAAEEVARAMEQAGVAGVTKGGVLLPGGPVPPREPRGG